MAVSLPSEVKKYFWGDDLEKLSWSEHKQYIVQTLLDKGDKSAVHWLLKQVDREELVQLLPELQLSPRSKNFWEIYLT